MKPVPHGSFGLSSQSREFVFGIEFGNGCAQGKHLFNPDKETRKGYAIVQIGFPVSFNFYGIFQCFFQRYG